MKFQHIHVKIWKMKVGKREEKHKEMHKRKLELLPNFRTCFAMERKLVNSRIKSV